MYRFKIAVVVLALLAAAACSEDPKEAAKRLIESGDRYAAQGKHSEAVLQYRTAVSRDPSNGPARFKLGEAYESTKELGNALGEYVRAADLMPENVEAQVKASTFLSAAGQYTDARQRAEAALEREPRNAKALIAAGNAAAGLKDIDNAISLVEDAVDAAPKTVLSYANLGLLQIAKGNREAAEAAFKRAVDVAPESVAAHLGLANFYWAAGQIPEAKAAFAKALEVDPDSPNVHRSLATFNVQIGDREAAERHLKAFADKANDVNASIALADFYLVWQRVPEAVKLLETVAKQPNGFALATMRLAAVKQGLGKLDEAHTLLDSILKASPSDEDALTMKARLHLVQQKPTDALAIATRIVERNPQSVSGLYIKGSALEAIGRHDEAIQTFKEALRISPALISAQLKLAGLYLATENPSAAIEFAAQAARAQPNSPDAHVMLAKAQLKSGNVTSARSEVNLLVKNFPDSAEVQHLYASLLRADGNTPRARAAFERALALDAKSLDALAGLLSMDVQEKRYDAARTRLDAALKSRENERDVWFLAGQVYQAIDDLPSAEAAFRRVLQQDSSSIDAYTRLAGLYFAQRRLDQALKEYEELEKRQSKPVMAMTLQGMILEMQNKPDEARKRYEAVLQLDARAAVAANNLSWMMAERGENLDLALTHAQTARAQLPDSGDVSDTLGWIYYRKGLNDTAVQTLRQAVQQSPNSALAHYHLGMALMKTDDNGKAEARRLFQQALKLDPQFDGAEDARRYIGAKTE